MLGDLLISVAIRWVNWIGAQTTRCGRADAHDVPVLILGETGTGKELFAEAIHAASDRKDKPFKQTTPSIVGAAALEKESGDRFIPLMESAPANAPKLLLGGREILLPDNVWFIGTANQDETTNELADKTHDRAFVMELHSRHREQQFEPRKGMAQATYSASSLRAAFAKAQRSYREEATQMLAFVGESKLTSVLEQQFSLGWGNRLERQALHFLPVVKAAGGTYEMALDHLLATRMFRAGKVTGRYDVKSEDLRNVENALNEVWGALFPSGMPERCLMAIEKDIKRLERGG